MTHQPKAISLTPNRWRNVILGDLVELHGFVQQIAYPSLQQAQALLTSLDEVSTWARAWHASAPPPEAQSAQAQPAQAAVPEATNGAAPAPKRGGWPKGRKRNQPQPAVTQ